MRSIEVKYCEPDRIYLDNQSKASGRSDHLRAHHH